MEIDFLDASNGSALMDRKVPSLKEASAGGAKSSKPAIVTRILLLKLSGILPFCPVI